MPKREAISGPQPGRAKRSGSQKGFSEEEAEYEASYGVGGIEGEDEAANPFAPIVPFIDTGWITEVVREVKSGKEATVYCCRAAANKGVEFYAAKVYRSRDKRNFKNDTLYNAPTPARRGALPTERRESRAINNKSDFGREVQAARWVGREFETLQTLYVVGADLPLPVAQAEGAILMEYFGDSQAPAPLLVNCEFERSEALIHFETIMYNIELWLRYNRVHGDLSPYNILYWAERVKIIDFPQAFDPRFNPNAAMLLARDIGNMCRYWAKFGVRADAERLSEQLWRRFERSQL